MSDEASLGDSSEPLDIKPARKEGVGLDLSCFHPGVGLV